LISGKDSFMARAKITSKSARARLALAGRIAALRAEMFGERGRAEMARRLGLPLRTWYNYEEGTAIPAEVILTIMELTSAEPRWLLYGTGPKYRPKSVKKGDERSPIKLEVCALLKAALELLESGSTTESATAQREAAARTRSMSSKQL
jgi:hypothetical protein